MPPSSLLLLGGAGVSELNWEGKLGSQSWRSELEMPRVSLPTPPFYLRKMKLRSQRLSGLPIFAGLVLVLGRAQNSLLPVGALSLPSLQTRALPQPTLGWSLKCQVNP